MEPSLGIYSKPTHTDLYLPWDSYHILSAKYSVINTLSHRAHTICSTPELLKNELQHLEKVLLCIYPKWAINKVFIQQQKRKKARRSRTLQPNTLPKCHIVVPYTQDICESLKNICGKYGVTVHFKGGQTLKNFLVSPKDKDSMTKKNSVIYSYRCGRIDRDEEYIGESSRTFGERFKEHLKVPSPIYEHQHNSGHKTTIANFHIIGR